MAIEKMSLIHLVGNMTDLDQTLLQCLNCGYFHPEPSIHSNQPSHGFSVLEGENPYTAPLNRLTKLARDIRLPLTKQETDTKSFVLSKTLSLLSDLEQRTAALTRRKKELKENMAGYEQAIIQLNHLAGLNVSFDDIFACEYVKVRFGRLPFDSYSKLNYYEDKPFFFFPFDNDGSYYWGVYFTPFTQIAVIDDIFSSLYFERVRIPDFAHGTPEKATQTIRQNLEAERAELETVRGELQKLREAHGPALLTAFNQLKIADAAFSLRKYVAAVSGQFYMVGFIPKAREKEFEARFDDIQSISCVINPYDADPSIKPPVKLKNNRFSKPFEMFVEMYSLPSYKDIDPTNLVAVTYTLLFGIMFGDLGQGLLIALAGWLLYRFKKMPLGRIMTRIGFSSAIFGVLYGSVFGFEDWLNPLYKGLFGMDSKPIHVMDNNTINYILGAAIGIGVLLISLSICINIYLGFKAKDYGRAIFSNNGIAGLVFYLALVYGVLDMMMLGQGVFTTPYVLGLIILPLLCMFLRIPLGKLLKGRKDIKPERIGEFIAENFFELFEFVLSFLSNSISFLRIGGFILSHAGLMLVVMTLTEMSGAGVNILVVIIGNIFVIALEGLIVGIQVLRLEFYEIFSRNFTGDGKPYEPAGVNYSLNE